MAARRLVVTRLEEIKAGVSNGKEWTLYAAQVKGEDGRQIPEQFKTFSACPIGDLAEYEVEPQEYKGRRSFLLKPAGSAVRRAAGSGGGRVVEELRLRVEQLEARLDRVEAGRAPAQRVSGPSMDPPAAADPEEDIPF